MVYNFSLTDIALLKIYPNRTIKTWNIHATIKLKIQNASIKILLATMRVWINMIQINKGPL